MFLIKLLKYVEDFFIDIDLYGHRIDLYINSKPLVKSRFGALISCLVLISCFITVVSNLSDWVNGANLQIISSSQSFSVPDLLQSNTSYIYEFDYTNFNIYFVLIAQPSASIILNFEDLERYVTQHVTYGDMGKEYIPLEFEKCYLRDKKAFLSNNFNASDNSKSSQSICIKEGTKLRMGIESNQEVSRVFTSALIYEIHKCENSTLNNFTCASDEEIENMLQYATVQVSNPKTILDFKNYQSPRKRTYNYQVYNLDISSTKMYTGMLTPLYLYTDQGVINDDYGLDSIDFNQDNLMGQSMIRKNANPVLFSYTIEVGLDQQIYYRRNLKFSDLISNFGGTINIFFIFGQFLCSTFNLMLLKHKLINISFENLEKKQLKPY